MFVSIFRNYKRLRYRHNGNMAFANGNYIGCLR